MPPMNVESFNLDHRAVRAPYVRVADVKHLPHGDVLTKYDVRFCQPNEEHLEMPAVHSIEHTFAERVRDHSDDVVDFSPMGCQTGFYLLMAATPDVPATIELVAQTFEDVLNLFQVVAVFVVDVRASRIKGGVDLHLHDVTEIVLRIQFPLAQVA